MDENGTSFREPARVVMHLNGGYPQVALERTIGSGMADGGICWDIPTDRIPFHLRAIGSRFLIVRPSVQPRADDSIQADDSVQTLRAAMHDLTIEERPDAR